MRRRFVLSSTLAEKLIKVSTIKKTSPLSESIVFENVKLVPTEIPMINVALSGQVDGGLGSGVMVIAGPSRHFKSAFALLLASAYLKADKDAIMLFYNSEFGTPPAYFKRFNIPVERVVHTPITDIEELKNDLVTQLTALTDKEKVVIVIDSIGNLASRKEVEDALNDKTVVDMTRAKALKSLFRMVTPQCSIKGVPLIAVNHTYKEMTMYPKDIVSGGTGSMLASQNVWIIGRQQEKTDNELSGYNFIIKVEKSRFVREGSKIPISVSFDGGIEKYSGLFELFLELGLIVKAGVGWYNRVDPISGEIDETKLRANAIEEDEDTWEILLSMPSVRKKIEERYLLVQNDEMAESD